MKHATPSKSERSMRLLPRTKKQWLWTVVGVIGVLIAAYAVCSVLTWKSFSRQATSVMSEKKADTQRAVAVVLSDKASREDKAASIERVASLDRRVVCSPSGLVAWQEGLFKLAATRERCEHDMQELASVVEVTKKLQLYLTQETTLNKALQPLTKTSAMKSEKEWKNAVNIVKGVKDEIASVNVEGAFTTTKATAEKSVTALYDSWRGLVSASDKKDQAKYSSAAKKLSASYTDLAHITNENTKQLDEVLSELGAVQL